MSETYDTHCLNASKTEKSSSGGRSRQQQLGKLRAEDSAAETFWKVRKGCGLCAIFKPAGAAQVFLLCVLSTTEEGPGGMQPGI